MLKSNLILLIKIFSELFIRDIYFFIILLKTVCINDNLC